jgi:hypothetical protein
LVTFDNQYPAVLQWPLSNDSRAWLFAAGWHPAESQLSRSSKFVPLMWELLEQALGETSMGAAAEVGEPLVAMSNAPRPESITRPDTTTVPWPMDEDRYTATDVPGRYVVTEGPNRHTWVVNLPPEESRVDPLSPEELEAYGVRLSTKPSPPIPLPRIDQLRQQQLEELEDEQQLWKWLLLAAGGCCMLETLLSRRGTGQLMEESGQPVGPAS